MVSLKTLHAYKYRIKNRNAKSALRRHAYAVNQVWNYARRATARYRVALPGWGARAAGGRSGYNRGVGPMIISVRGTSGSGKTYLARAVMKRLGANSEILQDGERQPVGYSYVGPPALRVLGRYNVASGGADRISNRDLAFTLIGNWAICGNVFYEGLLIGNEVQRTVLLNRQHPTHVIFLNTPLDLCLEAINARRAARGVTEPVSLKKTTEKFEELKRVRSRLKDAGVQTYFLGREAAFETTCNVLGVSL